jgi:hypothetical protein
VGVAIKKGKPSSDEGLPGSRENSALKGEWCHGGISHRLGCCFYDTRPPTPIMLMDRCEGVNKIFPDFRGLDRLPRRMQAKKPENL